MEKWDLPSLAMAVDDLSEQEHHSVAVLNHDVASEASKNIRLLYVQFYPHRTVELGHSSAVAETGLTSKPYFSLSLARLRSSYPGGSIPIIKS